MYIEAYLNRIYLKNKNVKVNIRLLGLHQAQNKILPAASTLFSVAMGRI